MATWSREEEATKKDTKQIDPNTQVRSGSGSSSQQSTQQSSSFQGLTGTGASAQEILINQLLYGTSTPEKRVIYKNSAGEEISQERYNMLSKQQVVRDGKIIPLATVEEVIVSPQVLGNSPDKMKAVQDLQTLLTAYSPDSAQGDSALAMDGMLRKSMEQNMPAIQRSIENAGTSGGSQEALLSQDLATRAAQEAAALSTKTKSDYGGISAQLNQVLASLVNTEDPSIKSLIQALDVGKVATSTSTGASSSSASQQESSNPLAITNPELFKVGTVSRPEPFPSDSGNAAQYYTPPAPASVVQSNNGMANGSGFIYSSGSGNTSLFGDTSLEDVKRKLLGEY